MAVSVLRRRKSLTGKQKEKDKLDKEKTERDRRGKDLRAYSEGLREMRPKTKTT